MRNADNLERDNWINLSGQNQREAGRSLSIIHTRELVNED